MAISTINLAPLVGTSLQQFLLCDEIVPGSQPGYETCKAIYSYHPHGAKLADYPIQMAQHKGRRITIQGAPDDGALWVAAFEKEYKAIRGHRLIFNLGRLARVYGVATLGLQQEGIQPKVEVDFKKLAGQKVSFPVWDPLNTAGSLVLNQDPNAMDFQKVTGVRVAGKPYHRSRTFTLMNEDPIYIEFTTSSFGYVGRSVYQRGLVPLKSFIFTMATNMMIALKAGVLITKQKSQSSAVDAPMQWFGAQKRQMVKEAQTGNVLQIDVDESIESLNLQNLDGAFGMARKNIIEDEAAACGTPAKIVLAETFAEGFGEGTEDARAVAQFIESIQEWLDPAYDWLDEIVMYRAWNPELFEIAQRKYPDVYGDLTFETAFTELRNGFRPAWPPILEEPEDVKAKAADVKLKAAIAVVEVLLPIADPENKVIIVEWLSDTLNEMKELFPVRLDIDPEALANYEPPQPMKEVEAAPPESSRDSTVSRLRIPERIDAVEQMLRLMDVTLPEPRSRDLAA